MTTTTPETTDARMAARLAALMKLRAERKDADDLPGTMTPRERNTYLAETARLDQRISAIRAAAATLAALPPLDSYTKWFANLTTWRKVLCDELHTLPTRVRDKADIDRQQNLTFSIKLIDFGFGISSLGVRTLEPMRIGQLMVEAGYEIQGEALRGPLGWIGSLPEVSARIKALTKQRTAAEAALDSLLRSDDEREKTDAESQEHRDALNTMDVKGNADGTGLVAFTKDGEPLSLADMTPAQRTAFTRFEAVACPPREPVEQ